MEINHGGGAARGFVLLIGGAPGGKRRQPVRPEAALGLLATLPPEALLGSPIAASVLQLADPADPQLLLAQLQTAARTPGPVLVVLVGQLTADRRRKELHLALAQTTRDNTRYTALPWAWLADQLRPRPLGSTTVLADLVADPDAWAVLHEHGPEALTAGLPLVGQVSPPGTTGDGYAPPYTRALVDHLRRARPGTRPAELHHLAGHSGLPAGAVLLTGEIPAMRAEAAPPPAHAAPAPAPALIPAPALPSPPLPAPAGAAVVAAPPAAFTQAPVVGPPAPALPTHAGRTAAPAAVEGLPAASVADRGMAADWPSTGVPAPAVPAPTAPGAGGAAVAPPSRLSAPTGAIAAVPAPAVPTSSAVAPTGVSSAVPAPAVPAAAPQRQWAEGPGPAAAAAVLPGREVGDPRPGIAAALHGGDLPRAAYLVADWERLLLRHQGPRAPQLADVAEAQAQLALAGGDLDRATERLIEAARLRMQQLPPQAPEVVTAVDNAVAIWGRLPRESALRHGVALLTLCRAVQASAGGGRLHDVETRLARLSERTGLLRRGR